MQDLSQKDINIETLRYYRNIRTITQGQLADKVGVDSSTYYKWETGRQGISDNHKIALAKALGMSLERLKLPLPEVKLAEEQEKNSRKNKPLNRMLEKTEIALTIVADTYHVNPADIRDLAPYLFHILAGASLGSRKQKANEVINNLSEVQRYAQVALPHLPHALLMEINSFDNHISEELEAIKNQQLFDVDFQYANDKDQTMNNPFTNYLRSFDNQVPEPLNTLFEVDWINDGLPMTRLSNTYLSELTQLPVDSEIFDKVKDLINCGKLSHTYFQRIKGIERTIADNMDAYIKEIEKKIREINTNQPSNHSGENE